MKITILQTGYVTGDFLNPVAYAGEMNSRVIEITHPLFENSAYQLLIVKENRPYRLGIQDGKVMLPPSLMDSACKLDCQFLAFRKNDSIDINANSCDCYPTSTNDCSTMLFKSDKFTMIVEEGLNINGLTAIPPYEEIVDMYNNLNKAKLAVEKAKFENENILNTINEKLNEIQQTNHVNSIKAEIVERKNEDKTINDKIDSLILAVRTLNSTIIEKSIYKITYMVNDAVYRTQIKRYDEDITILSDIPTDPDKVFSMWIDENDNTYTADQIYTLNKDLKLFPLWEEL